MFNFEELLKIFKTNWKNILNEILPKDNKYIIDDSFTNNFNSGAIIGFVSVILSFVMLSKFFYSLPRIMLLTTGLVIFNNYKKKEINSTIIFIVFVIASLGMLGSSLAFLFNIPLFGLTLLISKSVLGIFQVLCFGLDFISYAFIVVACMDFCRSARDSYEKENEVVKEEKIKLRTINVNDVGMHADINCPYCQSIVSVNDLFCQNCGKKLK